MKILVFSDLHAHNFKQFSSTKNGLNSRFVEILAVLQQIIDIGNKREVDLFLFAGDMFHAHTNVEHDVFNQTYAKFYLMTQVAPVLAIAGQHDLQIKKGYNMNHISFYRFTAMDGFDILDKQIFHLPHRGVTIYGHSWVHPGEFYDVPKTPADIGVFHEPVLNADIGGYRLEEGVKVANVRDLYKLTIFGDVHKPAYANRVLIPGAPLQHSFKDEGQKRGCWIVETDDFGHPEFIELSYTPFVTAKKLPAYPCYFRKELDTSKKKKLKTRSKTVAKDLAAGKLEEYVKEAGLSKLYTDVGYELLKDVDEVVIGIKPFIVKRVKLQNFMTFYGEHEFTFEDGVTVVYGQVDTFDSNGAGKSNLFDAISWCQYGKVSKDINAPSVINWDAGKDCYVSVEYEDGTVFTRYAKHSAYGNSFSINDTHFSSLKEAKSVLLPMVGSVDLFQNINYFSQENSGIFTHMKDAGRKKFLSDLLGFDKYIKAGKAARKVVSDLTTRHNSTKAKLEVYEQERDNIENKLAMVIELSEKFEAEQKEKIYRLQEDMDSYVGELQNISTEELEDQKTAITTEIASIDTTFDNEALDEVNQRLSAFQTKYDIIKAQVEKLVQKLESTDSMADTTCALCLRPVDGSTVNNIKAHYQNEIDTKRNELEKLQAKIDAAKALRLSLMAQREEAAKQVKRKSALQSKLTSIITKINDIEKTRQALETKISNIETKIEAIKNEVNPHIARKDTLAKELEEHEEKVNRLWEKLATIDIERKIYSFWADAFSTKTGSLVSYILDECVDLFNQEAELVSQAVFQNTMKIELHTAVHLKTSNDIVDKLRFSVLRDGREIGYGALSGGEKRRVDLVVFLAFGRVAMALFGLDEYPFGLAILDEAISALDEVGKDSVLEMFRLYGARKLYVVSHELYSVSAADHEVFIHKVDGKSSIVAMGD